MPSSMLSALSLASRTCPLGLLSVVSPADCVKTVWVYNEEVSGDIFLEHHELWRDADVILLSAHTGNIARCLSMARIASEEGKRVAIGGPEASMIGPSLLRDHPYIDVLVIGPGERVLEAILSADTTVIPPGVLFEGRIDDTDIFEHRPPHRSIDFLNIRVDYDRLFDLDLHDGLSYLWGNDCSQALSRCFFCGRLSMGVGYRAADHVWGELFWAYRRGIRSFYNTTDSVTTEVSEFRRFCEAKPFEMENDTHRVFVNANGVSKELVQGLKRLNGVAVLGIESFGRMEVSGKANTRVVDNLRAIEMLAENGIHMVLSFVWGLPGENDRTLSESEDGIIRLVSAYGPVLDAIHISPLLLTTGSPAWHRLMAEPAMRRRYRGRKVPFDVIEITNEYFRQFCSLSREFCIERIFCLSRELNSISPWLSVGAKGILKSEEALREKLSPSRSVACVRSCDDGDAPSALLSDHSTP